MATTKIKSTSKKDVPTITGVADIDNLAKQLRDHRATIADRMSALRDQIERAKSVHVPLIKIAVSQAKEIHAKLEAAVSKAPPTLFEDPRTLVVHGIRVGYMKGKGKIEYADEATVIARIRKHLTPEQAELLIQVKETVKKKALTGLPVSDLRAIGCTVIEAGDVVYIKPVDDEIDKLVNALLEEVTSLPGVE